MPSLLFYIEITGTRSWMMVRGPMISSVVGDDVASRGDFRIGSVTLETSRKGEKQP